MRRLFKQISIVLFAGTMVMLFAMQAYISKNNVVRNQKFLQSEFEKSEYRRSSDIEATEMDVQTTLESAEEDEKTTTSDEENAETYTRKYTKATHMKHTVPAISMRNSTMSSDEREKNYLEENPHQDESSKITDNSYDICPEYSSKLVGNLTVNSTYTPTEEEAILSGGPVANGCFEPTWCKPRQNVAIIIPYKDRLKHLITLMNHLHPILQRQSIRYCVFVAEEFDNGAFNKARVMNAAFLEITNNFKIKFDCIVFHDVDMLVEDDRNLHTCGEMPKHLSPLIDKFNYTKDYGTLFGGVTAISVENYRKVNGHGNNFWGWGGEDNDMERRIQLHNMTILATNLTYGRYKMIAHDHPWWFSPLYGVGSYLTSRTHRSKKEFDNNGLNDIRYKLLFTTRHKLWTKLTLDIRTFVVEKATIKFRGYDNVGSIELTSPSYLTENKTLQMINAMSGEDVCHYVKFTDKTVNKTLGLRENNKVKYGRMYSTLEEAEKICDEMNTFCGSIVEEHPGKFSLRSTALMHENYLRYRVGMVKQHEVIEEHHTLSVHAKVCPRSSSYLNFFSEPIVLMGDSKKGPSPPYSIEFNIRFFYDMNTTLTYMSDIMTAHKAISQDKVNHGLIEHGSWDTLGNVWSSKTLLLNTSSPKSLAKHLPEGYKTISDVVANSDGILTVSTPLAGVLRIPGCYVCRSTLMEENGATLLEWKWWFELRAKNKEIEIEILEKSLKKAKVASDDFSDTVAKRREMWLNYHEKLNKGKENSRKQIPDRILEIVRKESQNNV